MGILAECPNCHKKQSIQHKACVCGNDLDKSKRSSKVKYWISYYLPGGKQRRELVGVSIDDARAAFGKRKGQKKENKIFDILPESKMTFEELSTWYSNLESVKDLASYPIIKMKLAAFNREFGQWTVSDIRQADIENYQVKLKKGGLRPGTVDHNIRKVKTMVNKAFENDLVSGTTLKAFRRIKPTLKKGTDVRDRILSSTEFKLLMRHASGHTRGTIAMGYYTGMRRGEILSLTWGKVDLVARVIRLLPSDTKDKEARVIPICKELYKLLAAMPNRVQNTDKDGHVFQFKGQSVEDIRRGVRKACEAAKIEYGRFKQGGFIFHDLRHTFNTNMRKAGVSESVIMDITGHATREMFDRYNTIDDDDRQEAINRLGLFFESSDQVVTKPQKKGLRKNEKSS